MSSAGHLCLPHLILSALLISLLLRYLLLVLSSSSSPLASCCCGLSPFVWSSIFIIVSSSLPLSACPHCAHCCHHHHCHLNARHCVTILMLVIVYARAPSRHLCMPCLLHIPSLSLLMFYHWLLNSSSSSLSASHCCHCHHFVRVAASSFVII